MATRVHLRYLEAVCLLAVTACLCVLLLEGAIFIDDARDDLKRIADHVDTTLQGADKVIGGAGQVEGKLMQAADQQTTYFQKTQAQVYKLITDTKEIMVRTDHSLNDVLVPSVKQSVDASAALQAHATETIDLLKPGIEGFDRSAQSMEILISDPSLTETAENLNKTSNQVLGIATDAHTETGLIVDRTREAFKPQNKFLAIINGAIHGTLTFAELYYYLTK